jgi:AraC-like DNA-binding protein
VHAWRSKADVDTGLIEHTLGDDGGRSMLALVASSTFRMLRVSASLWNGNSWWSLHSEPSVVLFEHQHGVETDRWAYNSRQFSRVLASKATVRGEHGGFSDLFVPITVSRRVGAVLVVGPFATARPTSKQILARWRALTRNEGHATDPEFLAYLKMTLGTLVLEARHLAIFQRLLACFARLLGGQQRADVETNRIHALQLELHQARLVDETWDAVRDMIDDRLSLVHHSPARAYDLRRLGLARAANQVLVALVMGSSSRLDGVSDAVRLDAFQRHAVSIARETGDVLAGRVGDHGVVFVSAGPRSPQLAKRKLLELVQRTSVAARRRFDLTVHSGASSTSGSAPLSRCYQAALAAAESALSQNVRLVSREPGDLGAFGLLSDLREQLGRDVEEHPDRLSARFDRYLEVVAAHCGHRIEVARVHLEVGFDRVANILLRATALDAKSLAAMREDLQRSANDARSTGELVVAFRTAVSDLSQAADSPVAARRSRSVRRAIDLIHQRYGEPITLARAARAAGFAPKYFSLLFRKSEGKTFEKYLTDLRLERAKQLLTGTDLSATRVAELCGFRSPQYLSHVFRRAVGATPIAYRVGKLPAWAAVGRKRK